MECFSERRAEFDHQRAQLHPDSSFLELTFEDLIADSAGSARRLARFVGRDLDVTAMAAVVIPRTVACHPSLEFVETPRRVPAT
jgi:hypothetical protein